jgi:CheY-like chemotaxis protein
MVVEVCLNIVSSTGPLSGMSVLVVEDQFLIALEAQSMVEAAGADHVWLARSTDEATMLIERQQIDVAVLDLFLADGTTADYMARLRKRAIPFVIASGYDPSDLVAVAAPLVRKPYQENDLIPAILRAISEA